MEQACRRALPHECPLWVSDGQAYFVTICAAPRGENHLANDTVGPALIESFKWRHQQSRWHGLLFLIMPDHVHFLMIENSGRSLAKEIRERKKFTAREFTIPWQRDFFEHRLRHDESRSQRYDYILRNPVRAGLVRKSEDWSYVWKEMGRLGQPSLPS